MPLLPSLYPVFRVLSFLIAHPFYQQISRIKIATEKDFDAFRALLNEDDPMFQLVTNKKGTRVWQRMDQAGPVKTFRVSGLVPLSV